MPLHCFGATDLPVTPLCLGGAPLADIPDLFGPVPEAREGIRARLDSPINFVDTAAVYGDG